CGLLWGRDLDLFYEQSRRMMFAVPEQIPIEVLIEKPPQPVDPTPVPARMLQKKLAVPIRSQPHKRIKAEAFANVDLQTVCAYLTDPYWANRVKAVQALGNLGDLQAIKPLIACLQDENGVVFKTAVSTLGQIGGHEASAALVIALFEQDRYFDAHEPTPHSSTYITTALKRMPETAVPFLLAALTNKQWATTGRTGRWRAAYVLGVLRVKTAVPDLLRLLREGDDDVRPSIATALGAIGDPVALSGLQAAAQQDPLSTVRASAKRAASLL
ncbi:MAG: HEAT repeat domain-containing protein, partial [Chloroflexi bacterium]|nr:HEAT repeat domain-containing protein [Chloroflexota bacterium]